jgi:hypothetical protein
VQTELARQYQAKAQEGESARTRSMALLDAYYHGCQYEFLPRVWHEDIDTAGQPVPFRSRRPSTVLPIPRVIVDVFNRALWGSGRRPKATLADGSPDDNSLLDDIIAEARLHRAMAEATRRALTIGTGLVVWRLQGGHLAAEVWDAKHTQPTFRPGKFPELERLDYRFKYTREVPDGCGGVKPTTYWHREVIDGKSWTVYQDAEVSETAEPEWREDSALSVKHSLGFVPAIWFTIGERGAHDFDGTGVFAPYLGLIDELNYTASQMGRALYYNLDPQTVLSGVADGDIDALLKGGRNTWCLPERAEAKLLESSGTYVEQAAARIDGLRKAIFDAAGIVLPDPERVHGAQSGTSLELLAAPQIARVDGLREDVGDAFVRLLEQILVALTSPGLAPDKARIDVRDGKPRPEAKLGRVVLSWGSHFPLTPTDTATAAQAAREALGAGIVSRQAAALTYPLISRQGWRSSQIAQQAPPRRQS